jgi:hypothetical protein
VRRGLYAAQQCCSLSARTNVLNKMSASLADTLEG